MIRTFERDGIRFRYPATWTVESVDDDPDGGGWTISVQSPATAFVLVSLRPDADNPADLADQVLHTLEAEYKELDAVNSVVGFAGLPSIGHDVDFLTLDTAVTCWTRCVQTPAGPLVVMCQASERDRVIDEPVLQAICASFEIDEE